jgi:hypothetical protein
LVFGKVTLNSLFLTHLFSATTKDNKHYSRLHAGYVTFYANPGYKIREHFSFAIAHFYLVMILIAVLVNVPPDAGFQKKANFSTLNVGLARTWYQTPDNCVTGSGSYRSAIHYDPSLVYNFTLNRVNIQAATFVNYLFISFFIR